MLKATLEVAEDFVKAFYENYVLFVVFCILSIAFIPLAPFTLIYKWWRKKRIDGKPNSG